MVPHFAGLAALGTRGRNNSFSPPCPHDGGARFGRTIASGPRFAFLRAAPDGCSDFPPAPMTGEGAPGPPSPPANPSHSSARRLMPPADFVCLKVLRGQVRA